MPARLSPLLLALVLIGSIGCTHGDARSDPAPAPPELNRAVERTRGHAHRFRYVVVVAGSDGAEEVVVFESSGVVGAHSGASHHLLTSAAVSVEVLTVDDEAHLRGPAVDSLVPAARGRWVRATGVRPDRPLAALFDAVVALGTGSLVGRSVGDGTVWRAEEVRRFPGTEGTGPTTVEVTITREGTVGSVVARSTGAAGHLRVSVEIDLVDDPGLRSPRPADRYGAAELDGLLHEP